MNPDIRIGIIGAGRLGTALAHSLAQCGVSVRAVYDISPVRASALADSLSIGVSSDLTEMTTACDAVIVAVKDEALFGVGAELSEFSGHRLKYALHTSGLFPHSVIASPPEYSTASLHPPVAVSQNPDTGLFKNFVWTLQGEAQAVRFGASVIEVLGGKPVIITAENKAIYHAACAVLSNNVFTAFAKDIDTDRFYESATALFGLAGIGKIEASQIADGLIRSAAINYATGGMKSLTGAVARGDLTTIMVHLRALSGTDFRAFYLDTALELADMIKSPVLQALGEIR